MISAKNEEEQHQILENEKEKCKKLADLHGNRSGFCPWIWDQILCWEPTPPDELSIQPCPSYIFGFDPNFNASKQCLSDGTWFFNESARWTNYSACYHSHEATMVVDFVEVENSTFIANYVPILKTISLVGYSVSLTTLVVAFLILATLKRLQCPRNRLHLHLFLSFIMRAFVTLLKDSLFVQGVGLASDIVEKDGEKYFLNKVWQNWECKAITTLWQYFIMANYSWILMEGLYIHNLIILALIADSNSILMYIFLGWGSPIIFVVSWAILRVMYEDSLCWTTHNNPLYFLVIRIPIMISILTNFILFVNIVRLLLVKVRSSYGEEAQKYGRWAKSTLVLVPLFGVHYFVFIGMSYSMRVNETVEIIWLFCDMSFASFQGFFVAVLYCFMNGEVQTELASKWRRIKCPYKKKRSNSQPQRSSFASLSTSYSFHGSCNVQSMCGLFNSDSHYRPESRISRRTETMEFVTIDSLTALSSQENVKYKKFLALNQNNHGEENNSVELKLMENHKQY